MKHIWLLIPAALITLGCAKKLEDLEANNVPYNDTHVTITEVISMDIPNSAFNWGGFLNCTSIPFGGTSDYDAFIATQNPNPYAHMVEDIQALEIKMELTNIPDCDFDMLQSVEVYLVDLADTCGNVINDANQLVLPDDGIIYKGTCNTSINEPGPYYNAVLLGSYDNFFDGMGDIIYLNPNPDARMDQFIHAQNFQTYTKLVFDKAFTESSANIKTTMSLKAMLINEE